MRFKMAQPSYIDGTTYAEGGVLELPTDTRHVPGPHWEPMDDDARAHCKKHDIAFTGFVPDSVDKMAAELDDAMKRNKLAGDPAAIGAAVVSALQDAGVVPGKKKPAAAQVEI